MQAWRHDSGHSSTSSDGSGVFGGVRGDSIKTSEHAIVTSGFVRRRYTSHREGIFLQRLLDG